MSLAKDSANNELFVRVYICRGACLAFCFLSCIWLCRLVYVMSCVCMRVRCMGCCVNSYRWVGCVSRSGLMGVVAKVRFGDLYPSTVFVLTWMCVFLFFPEFMFSICIMLGLAGHFRIL